MSNAFIHNGLFGSLFSDTEVAQAFAAENFVQQMIGFERAWTLALIETEVVDAEAGNEALIAIDQFRPDTHALARASEKDGLPVPELVRQLRLGLPERSQLAIHSGATSQDVIDTATVMICLGLLKAFEGRVAEVTSRLKKLDARFGVSSPT